MFPLISKFDVFSCFAKFHSYIERQFPYKLKVLHSDNGTEYINHNFHDYCAKFGIIHQTFCPYTPEQNSVSEHKHRYLIETTRSLLHHASVPPKYWVEALSIVTYLINRLPSLTIKNLSPFETLVCMAPDYTLLKVFGCMCFPWLCLYTSSKLSPQSQPCCFLGYCPYSKGYRCLNMSSHKIYISCHVTLIEYEFPFTKLTSSTTSPSLHFRDVFYSYPTTSSPPVTSPNSLTPH